MALKVFIPAVVKGKDIPQNVAFTPRYDLRSKTGAESQLKDKASLSGGQEFFSGLAHNVNAQSALKKKMSALEGAQKDAVKTVQLSDGRIRYYDVERQARKPGQTRSSSFVTEYNPRTGQVRQWNESYDQFGNINRVHPKTLDGQDVRAQHYPPTKSELEPLLKKAKRSK